jgi:hypothetical protein
LPLLIPILKEHSVLQIKIVLLQGSERFSGLFLKQACISFVERDRITQYTKFGNVLVGKVLNYEYK